MRAPLTTQESTGARYQLLEIFRGLISLWVVLEHAGVALQSSDINGSSWAGSIRSALVTALNWNIGTPLFFVISGYCIAGSLVSARRKGTTAPVFLGRRLWRIYPTYWAAVLGLVALVLALDALGWSSLHKNGLSLEIGSPRDLTASQWIGNLTLTETWRPILMGPETAVFTRVAWSLCYLEQFYLLCVIAVALWPERFGRALAVATAAIVFFRVAAWDSGALHRIDGLFPVRWHEFAVGLAVYWRLNGPTAASFWHRRGLEAFILAVLGIACLHQFVSTIASALLGLALIVMYRWDGVVSAFGWLAPLRKCGTWSYSIYLTHLPVVAVCNPILNNLGLSGFWARTFVLLPMVAAVSMVVGWAFYQAVERRFLAPPNFSKAFIALRGRRISAAQV